MLSRLEERRESGVTDFRAIALPGLELGPGRVGEDMASEASEALPRDDCTECIVDELPIPSFESDRGGFCLSFLRNKALVAVDNDDGDAGGQLGPAFGTVGGGTGGRGFSCWAGEAPRNLRTPFIRCGLSLKPKIVKMTLCLLLSTGPVSQTSFTMMPYICSIMLSIKGTSPLSSPTRLR